MIRGLMDNENLFRKGSEVWSWNLNTREPFTLTFLQPIPQLPLYPNYTSFILNVIQKEEKISETKTGSLTRSTKLTNFNCTDQVKKQEDTNYISFVPATGKILLALNTCAFRPVLLYVLGLYLESPSLCFSALYQLHFSSPQLSAWRRHPSLEFRCIWLQEVFLDSVYH